MPGLVVLTSIYLFSYTPPCYAPTRLHCSDLHCSTCLWMFVRYNNGHILPWTISVFGGALFRKRSASRPPKGAAPHNTWRSDCRYLGSTPGCEARNSTSGGAAYSTVACRKRNSGKGKGTVCPVTCHEAQRGSHYSSTGQCSIHSADRVYSNGSNEYAASIFKADVVGVKVHFAPCCSHIVCSHLLLAPTGFPLPSLPPIWVTTVLAVCPYRLIMPSRHLFCTWRWRQNNPSKYSCAVIRLHGVTNHNPVN